MTAMGSLSGWNINSEVNGVVAPIRFGDEFALSHLSSGYGFDLGCAEGR
ncbi:hypothetical protein CLV89_1591, partial [Tritonibacter scottomollicae]